MNRFVAFVYFVSIAGTFLLVAWLVSIMRRDSQPPALGAARAEERRKAADEFRAAGTEGLHGWGWVDQGKGIARMPISNAMVLTIREWQNPAAARSNMVALAEKAAAVPPPPPNPFE